MAYLIIAVGAVMGLFGAYEIYVGNAIISVERGWSAFISGSVLVAGGVVTIAIGVAIRAIHELRSALMRAPAVATATPELPGAPAEPVEIGAVEEDRSHSPAPFAAGLAAERTDLLPTPTVEAYPIDVMPAQSSRKAAAEKPAAPTEPDIDSLADLRLRPSLDAEPVASPAMDDWLERSFADLDHDTSVDAARAAATRAHAVLDHDVLAPPADRDGQSSPSRQLDRVEADHHSESVEAKAPDHATPSSSVIGRYEADGTSYVMYADGSIEAQSAAGIYRFASMTELRDFIES